MWPLVLLSAEIECCRNHWRSGDSTLYTRRRTVKPSHRTTNGQQAFQTENHWNEAPCQCELYLRLTKTSWILGPTWQKCQAAYVRGPQAQSPCYHSYKLSTHSETSWHTSGVPTLLPTKNIQDFSRTPWKIFQDLFGAREWRKKHKRH